MSSRMIGIQVRCEFVVPDVYTSGTTEEIEEALWIGSVIQNAVRTKRDEDVSVVVERIVAEKDAEMNKAVGKYVKQIEELGAEQKRLVEEHERVMAEGKMLWEKGCDKKWNGRVSELEREVEMIRGRYEVLEARKCALETERDVEVKRAVEGCQKMMERIVAEKELQVKQMIVAYRGLENGLGMAVGEIEKLGGLVQKRMSGAVNVKTKGNEYEREFRDKLVRAYGLCVGFSLKETRLGMGHEMDFIMGMEGGVVMWELKDYSAVVPKSEVEKFMRDLKGNELAKIGVMVSRRTDIVGRGGGGGSGSGNGVGDITVDFYDDKMMIFLNRFEECEDEGRVLQMMACLFRTWWEQGKVGMDMDRIGLMREIEKGVGVVGERRKEWRQHKSKMEEIVRWMSGMIEESEGRLERLLDRVKGMRGGVGEMVDDEEEMMSVFREVDDRRSQDIIQNIMKVCKIGDGNVELREIVEGLVDGGYYTVSRDTVRSYVMSVLRDEVVGRRGAVKTVGGLVMRG
jgi:hypothetical protein